MKKYLIYFTLILFCKINSYGEDVEFIVKVKDPKKFEKSSFTQNTNIIYSKFIKLPKSLEITLSNNYLLNELDKYYIFKLSNEYTNILLSELKSNYEIISITPNYKYKLHISNNINDEKLSFQWALTQIRAFDAWKQAGGRGIIIGVIDTGIDFYHPDLVNNLWINTKEDLNKNGTFEPWQSNELRNGISGDLNGIDEDNNGFADDVIGYDFVNQLIPNLGDWSNPDPIPNDEYDHGTAVAGVIAAEQNNGIGISGLAYNSKIMMCRVFDVTGNASASDIAAAIVYATLNGAKILNFSFGEKYSSPLMHDAIKFAFSQGVIMVASSGNDGSDAPHYPSDYPEVISVGGSDSQGKRWKDSNFGGNLCLLAPAQSIITTTPNKSYGMKSGTSLSAPYVSAAIALMLEKNPNLTFNDIKSILMTTAKNIDPDGWNYQTGAGILDVSSALDNLHYGKIEMSSPKLYEQINKDKQTIIPIIGSTLTPLFDTYQILIGKGKYPNRWDTLSPRFVNAKLEDTLYLLDVSKLEDTLYTINVVVELKNKKKLQLRTQIIIYSNNSPLQIDNFVQRETLFNDKNVLSVYFSSTYDAFSLIQYRKKNSSEQFRTISGNIEKSKNHLFLITDFDYEQEYESIAHVFLENGDTAKIDFSFKLTQMFFPKYSFKRKNYTLPRALIFPKISDINNNNKPNVLFNDISSLAIKNAFVAEFDNGKFNIIDSLQENGIVTGIGNYNGNNLKDFLLYSNGNTSVYEQSENKKRTFHNKIFSSQTYNFWAEHFHDINGDGKDEIIAHNDSCFFVYSRIGNKDNLIAQTTLPKELSKIGVWRGSALGDFNNNGKQNLYHSNNYGHSFIYEFDNNRFELIYSNTQIKASENQYVTKADVDGDGIPEIVHSSYHIYPGRNDPSDGLWYVRIIKHSPEKGFYILDSLFIYGVRAGTVPRIGASYRNGVASGNLDGLDGDEIIISVMPNLYVFKWNTFSEKLEPLWYYPLAFSNSAFCYDFDKNGRQEIGFATFDKTEFWEYVSSPKLSEPYLNGFVLNNSSVKLFWNKVPGATRYNCFMLVDSIGNLNYIGSYKDDFAIIDNLDSNKYYSFFINAENDSTSSNLSNSVTLYVANLSQATFAEAINCSTIVVNYSGVLETGRIEIDKFIIFNEANNITMDIKSIMALSNKVYLSLFDCMETGSYKLLCGAIKDGRSNNTEPNVLYFHYDLDSVIPNIYLSKLKLYTNNYLQIEYSEAPDTSALNLDNYVISPIGKIIGVNKIPGDGRLFELALSNELPIKPKGFIYYITAKNITTETGKRISQGAGNTLAFVISASSLRNFYVYPHPISYQNHQNITIAGLTSKAIIEVLTLDGEVLNTLKEQDADGGYRWNLQDKLGNKLKPGVYLLKITNIDNPNEDYEMKKILIKP